MVIKAMKRNVCISDSLPNYLANLGWIHYQLEQKNEFLVLILIEVIAFTFHKSSMCLLLKNFKIQTKIRKIICNPIQRDVLFLF